jgi:hypothetical protein
MFPYLSKKIRRRAYWLAFQSFVCGLSRNDVDNSAATFDTEFNGASGKSEQGVILATANVHSGVEVGAALTNDDFACVYNLASVTLHAETLCVRVAAVTGRANTFFGSHFCSVLT